MSIEVVEIAVSAGADEPVTAVITEEDGRDLTAVGFEWALLPQRTKPSGATSWTALTPERPAPNVVRIEAPIGTAWPLGRYRLWVRITDGDRERVRPVVGLVILY